VEAFKGSPGVHQGVIDGMLKDSTQVANVGRPTTIEIREAEEDASEAEKVALLINGADKTRFGRLKDKLANNYLLGTDQYPDTYKKIMRIHQTTKTNRPFQGDSTKSGLAFIQRGGRGPGCEGCGGRAGRGSSARDQADTGGGADASSATTGFGDQASMAVTPRVKKAGDSHCYNCGKTDHWAYQP
jgi:hypothetical protein